MQRTLYVCDICGREFKSDFYAYPANPIFRVAVDLIQNHCRSSFVHYLRANDEQYGRGEASTNGNISLDVCAGCLTGEPLFTKLQVVAPEGEEESGGDSE